MGPKRRRALTASVYTVVLATAAIQLYRQAPHTPYATDESGWIRNSIHIAEIASGQNSNTMRWEFFDDASFGSMNPHLGKLGFVVTALCLRGEDGKLPEAPGRYLVGKSREENVAEGRVAAPELLHPMRRSTIVWGVMLLLALMALAHAVAGLPAAFAAGALVAVNPLFRELSTQAMTDVPYVLFLVLTALAGVWTINSTTRPQSHRNFAAACVLATLAAAVKLAAVIILTPYLAVIAMLLCMRGTLRKWEPPLMLLESLVVFTLLAIVLNPYLWPDLSRVSPQQLREDWRLLRHGEFELQSGDTVPGWIMTFHRKPLVEGINKMEPQALSQFRGALWDVSTRDTNPGRDEHPANVLPALDAVTRPLQLPLLYLRWSAYKEFLFNAPHWHKPTWSGGLYTLFGKASSIPMEWAFALAGFAWLAFRARSVDAAKAFLAFVLIVLLVVILTRLADHERYLFPVLLMRTTLAAMAIAVFAQWLWRRWRPVRKEPEAAPA